jgi:hypothetical protein
VTRSIAAHTVFAVQRLGNWRCWRSQVVSTGMSKSSRDEHDWERGEVQAAPRGEDS